MLPRQYVRNAVRAVGTERCRLRYDLRQAPNAVPHPGHRRRATAAATSEPRGVIVTSRHASVDRDSESTTEGADDEPAPAPAREETAAQPRGETAAPAANGVARAPRERPAGDQRRSRPPARREGGTPRAPSPGTVPAPEHHHLPGWVRRAYAQARPELADLLGHLEGEPRAQLQRRVDELTATISSGRFSAAWQYPQVIEEGRALFAEHRAAILERQRAHRAVDTARRRVAAQLTEHAAALPTEASARLQRALRSATDVDAVQAVGAEVSQLTAVARTSQDRRRDREIERTRARIARSAKAAPPGDSSESWQDVLRRLASQE